VGFGAQKYSKYPPLVADLATTTPFDMRKQLTRSLFLSNAVQLLKVELVQRKHCCGPILSSWAAEYSVDH
jgi:hypothetical protein